MAIDHAFREMMLEGGYASITVRGLCERARVNKNTFYRYYGALEDLMAEVMGGYARAWRERTANLDRVADAAEVTRELFRFGAAQDALYDAITCDPAWGAVQRRLQDDASGERERAVPDGFAPEQWRVYYAFVSQAGLAMYRAWVGGGKATPTEQVAELAARAVEAGAREIIGSYGVKAV